MRSPGGTSGLFLFSRWEAEASQASRAAGGTQVPPTCIRDHQPASEEVEGPIGHVAGATGQGAEVVLGGEAGNEVLGLRGG